MELNGDLTDICYMVKLLLDNEDNPEKAKILEDIIDKVQEIELKMGDNYEIYKMQ